MARDWKQFAPENIQEEEVITPKKNWAEFAPEKPEMVDTFLGKMQKNMPLFKMGSPENKAMSEELIGTLSGSPGIKSVVEAPFKITKKGIINKVLNSEKLQKAFHTNEYNKVWQKAKEFGLDKVHFNPESINMAAIKKYTSEKWHGALDKFTKNPTLENAQKAQSDLGKLERELGKKATLTSEEKATLDAAKSAKEHIRDSMFKTEKGELNAPLKNMYDKVTKSYEENVIPYTTNKAIQEFKRGDITAKELIQKISKGKFRARKGKDHPELAGREITLDVLNKLGLPVGTGGAIAGGNWLINKLTSD